MIYIINLFSVTVLTITEVDYS